MIFVPPLRIQPQALGTKTHSLTMKLRHDGNFVGQLALDSWISVLPTCPAPESELGVHVYDSIVRALLAPINGLIEQCIDEAKSGSRKNFCIFPELSFFQMWWRLHTIFRVRREIKAKGLDKSLSRGDLERMSNVRGVGASLRQAGDDRAHRNLSIKPSCCSVALRTIFRRSPHPNGSTIQSCDCRFCHYLTACIQILLNYSLNGNCSNVYFIENHPHHITCDRIKEQALYKKGKK